nr:hypothetical protein Itr_chr14CG19490 [Ipomoea trifida]
MGIMMIEITYQLCIIHENNFSYCYNDEVTKKHPITSFSTRIINKAYEGCLRWRDNYDYFPSVAYTR